MMIRKPLREELHLQSLLTIAQLRADDEAMTRHQRRQEALRAAGMDETNTRAFEEQLRDSGRGWW